MAEEVLQQFELLRGEIHRLALARHLATAQIYLDITKRVAVLLFGNGSRTAEDGLYASQQLTNGERLGDIIIRTQLEPDDFVHFLATRGQHDDRNERRLDLSLLQKFRPPMPGHHDMKITKYGDSFDGRFQASKDARAVNDIQSSESEL